LMVSCGFSSLATMAMDISVQKDWVPTVITGESKLSLMNTRMTQVDLISEVAGPFIAGALLLIPNVTLTWTFIGIAVFNYLTFGPEYLLLRSVFHSVQDLRKLKKIPESKRFQTQLFLLLERMEPRSQHHHRLEHLPRTTRLSRQHLLCLPLVHRPKSARSRPHLLPQNCRLSRISTCHLPWRWRPRRRSCHLCLPLHLHPPGPSAYSIFVHC